MSERRAVRGTRSAGLAARSPRAWIAALLLAALTGSAVAAAPGVDLRALATLPEGAGSVTLATLQAERARWAAVAAGAVVSGTLRTSADATWRAEAAGAAAPAGWDASLGALTLSTQWYVVPAGPTHDAAQRAARGYAVALQAVADARRDAVLDALERIVALDRLQAQEGLALARLDLARRTRAVVADQVDAGTASANALADADLAVVQAEGDLAAARADDAAARRAFERAFGVAVETVWSAPGDPLTVLAELAAAPAPDLPPTLPVTAAEVDAAIAGHARVAEATRALDDAVTAVARARREAGVTASVSARVTITGEDGRYALGGSWDSRSLQPSADLSLDPWSDAPTQTTVALGATLSLPIGVASAAGVAQAEIDEALALERLQQAWSAAALELETQLRAADQAERALALAVDRLGIRSASVASARVRADLGALSPIDLARAELDALDAALSVLRAQDQARSATTRVELTLGRTPSDPWIAAALAAATTEVP